MKSNTCSSGRHNEVITCYLEYESTLTPPSYTAGLIYLGALAYWLLLPMPCGRYYQ